MRVKYLLFLASLLVFSLLTAGCGAPAQPAAEPTVAEQATAAPTEQSEQPLAPTEAPAEATEAPSTPTEPAAEPTEAAAEATEQGGQALVVGQGAIPVTGDPARDTGAWALAAYAQIFDTLVVVDENGKLQPSVATSWEPVDELTWEFKLRDDVTFQNGEPLDAAAVKFTIDRMLSDETIPWRSTLDPIESTDVVDETTIRVRTTRPFGPLVQKMLVVFIIPPQYYEEVGGEGFAEKPIGSGPFQWVDFDPLTHLTVEAWPDSWRWQGEQPQLTTVTWRKLPEDSTRVAALQAGEIDVAVGVPPETVEQLTGQGITAISQPIAQTNVVNLRSTWDTPLADIRVRQALNYAIDKEALLEGIMQGEGTPAASQLVGPDAFGFNPDLEPYPYDPERARQLLAEAGYPDGFEVTYHGSIGRYPKDKEVSEVIVAQLAEVGVTANLEFLENVVFSEMSREGTIGPLNIYGWQYMPAMDINQPIPFFKCETPRKNFCDPQLDQLIEEMEGTLDEQAREEKAHEMAAYLAETAPVIFLWQFHSIYGIQPYVQNFEPTSAFQVDLTKVAVAK